VAFWGVVAPRRRKAAARRPPAPPRSLSNHKSGSTEITHLRYMTRTSSMLKCANRGARRPSSPLRGRRPGFATGYYWPVWTGAMRTSENSVMAKFAELSFSALGRSSFDGAAPAETQAHRSDDQCQRICPRPCCTLQPLVASRCRGQGFRIVYCCQEPL
jgi:hypothetical protein